MKKLQFDIPVCLMFFKRIDKLNEIINVLREVKPSVVYLLSDGGRNDEEKQYIEQLRTKVISWIDWDCEIRRIFHEENVGVCLNIGGGALQVFKEVDKAIFLEDDNLPSVDFFSYCEEMLIKYENDDSILWICGTSYFPNMSSEFSYYKSQHLLPCGWASWSKKFTAFYDINLNTFADLNKQNNFKKSYGHNRALYKQQYRSAKAEYDKISAGKKPTSWDYQMIYSVRSNNMFAIAPCSNLIKNIGVDDLSIHGGFSKANIMTRRFCEIELGNLKKPIVEADSKITKECNRRIGKTILYPFSMRFKNFIKRILRKLKLYDK